MLAKTEGWVPDSSRLGGELMKKACSMVVRPIIWATRSPSRQESSLAFSVLVVGNLSPGSNWALSGIPDQLANS